MDSMDCTQEMEAMIMEHNELMNAIEIIAETSDTIEEFLEKFRKLRDKEKEPTDTTTNQ